MKLHINKIAARIEDNIKEEFKQTEPLSEHEGRARCANSPMHKALEEYLAHKRILDNERMYEPDAYI